jgi:hypothetical protein
VCVFQASPTDSDMHSCRYAPHPLTQPSVVFRVYLLHHCSVICHQPPIISRHKFLLPLRPFSRIFLQELLVYGQQAELCLQEDSVALQQAEHTAQHSTAWGRWAGQVVT